MGPFCFRALGKCLANLVVKVGLANSVRTVCTNAFLSNSNGWHLIIEAYFY